MILQKTQFGSAFASFASFCSNPLRRRAAHPLASRDCLLMPLLLVFLLILAGFVLTVRAVSARQIVGKLKLGDPIPAVTSEDQDGNAINLAKAGGRRYTLVYFYPKAMTAGCTAQACSLRDAYSEIESK